MSRNYVLGWLHCTIFFMSAILGAHFPVVEWIATGWLFLQWMISLPLT